MTEQQINALNEVVGKALGWIPSHDQQMFPGQWESPGLRITQLLPDFYGRAEHAGEMICWLWNTVPHINLDGQKSTHGWLVDFRGNGVEGLVAGRTLNTALCLVIQKVAETKPATSAAAGGG